MGKEKMKITLWPFKTLQTFLIKQVKRDLIPCCNQQFWHNLFLATQLEVIKSCYVIRCRNLKQFAHLDDPNDPNLIVQTGPKKSKILNLFLPAISGPVGLNRVHDLTGNWAYLNRLDRLTIFRFIQQSYFPIL